MFRKRVSKVVSAARAVPLTESLEPRQMFATTLPLGINFNDELTSNRGQSAYDTNFNTAVTELKKLGVQAVRLYVTTNWTNYNTDQSVLDRAFTLANNFDVLLVVTPDSSTNNPSATTAAKVQNYFDHIVNYTNPSNSSQKLGDVVDKWEIGNEVNKSEYWTGTLQQYIDNMLTPAVNSLVPNASDPNKIKVSSAGLTYGDAVSPVDTFLQKIPTATKRKLSYIGYHPYTTSVAKFQSLTTNLLNYSAAHGLGLPLLATEWGGNNTGNDTTWAALNDAAFPILRDNYAGAYYFASVDNSFYKDGAHRQMSVLKHNYTGSVSNPPTSAEISAFRQSPLQEKSPFFGTYIITAGRPVRSAAPRSTTPTATASRMAAKPAPPASWSTSTATATA